MKHPEKVEISRLIPLPEAARLLGISKETLLRRIHEGYVKAVRLGGLKRWSIEEDEFLRYRNAAVPIEPKNRIASHFPDLDLEG